MLPGLLRPADAVSLDGSGQGLGACGTDAAGAALTSTIVTI